MRSVFDFLFVIIGIAVCAYGLATIVLPASLLSRHPDQSMPLGARVMKFTFLNRAVLIDLHRMGRWRGLIYFVPGLVFILFGLTHGSPETTVLGVTNTQIFQTQWITDAGVSRERIEYLAVPYKNQATFEEGTRQVYVFFYAKASGKNKVIYWWAHEGEFVTELVGQYGWGYNDVRLEQTGTALSPGKHTVEIIEPNLGTLAHVEFVIGSLK
jgi:hypothetical protein